MTYWLCDNHVLLITIQIINNNNNVNINPISHYPNAEQNKSLILKDNKKKLGVYRWNNIITDKSYVGSYIPLSNRLRTYYYLGYIKKKPL